MNGLKSLFLSLRPKQWIKNSLLFAGWLFSLGARAFDIAAEAALFSLAFFGFIAFCLLSSSVYLVNDIVDIEEDRRHPDKRNRPIAAGQFPIPAALASAAVALVLGMALSFTLSLHFGGFATAYFAVLILYSFVFKRVLILDSMVIAFGFVMRAVAGAVAVGVSISIWLIICTIFLALFLGFGKRHSELQTLGENAAAHRGVLAHYSPHLLELLLSICGTLALISYSLYSISQHARESFGVDVILTLPFVFFGLFRYLYLVVQEHRGGDPGALLLSDAPLFISVVLWIAVSALLLIWQPGLLSGVLF